jgi:hypothetical protein
MHENVWTISGSTRETIGVVEQEGGLAVATGAIFDRSSGRLELNVPARVNAEVAHRNLTRMKPFGSGCLGFGQTPRCQRANQDVCSSDTFGADRFNRCRRLWKLSWTATLGTARLKINQRTNSQIDRFPSQSVRPQCLKYPAQKERKHNAPVV